ncbi:MAG: leucine-rich repeat domain-containing protein [Mycoplasmoidaceae bacterium]|nr:leucine-rich repeat domain-containing protein [Mycoplasmoidaceae bacterium]
MNRSDFNLPIYLSSNLYTINEYFLNNCSSFNSPIFLPNSLVTIDKYFLYNCSAFNQMIDLPDSLRYIYSSFLRGCKEFNNDIHLSKNIEKVGNNFLYDCYKMSMTVYIDCDFNKLDQKDDYQNKTMFAESNVGAIVDPTPMYICCDDIKGFNQLFPAYIVTGSHRRRLAYHECPFQTTGRIYTCHSRI